jgi:hypothetical protein
LLHFLLNQLLFFGRYPDDKLFVSCAVLHLCFAPFCARLRFGFWLKRVWAAAQQAQENSRERKRNRLIFGQKVILLLCLPL